MDGGAWRATVHGVAKSRTRLSDFTFIWLSLGFLRWQGLYTPAAHLHALSRAANSQPAQTLSPLSSWRSGHA